MGNRKKAWQLMRVANRLAKESKQSNAIMNVYEMKYNLYKLEGNLEKALYYYTKYEKLNHDIFSEDNANRLAKLRTKMEKLETERNTIKATAITVSHELSQPMMVMQGNLDMLYIKLCNLGLTEDFMKYKEKIDTSFMQMKELLDRFTNSEKVDREQYTENIDMMKL